MDADRVLAAYREGVHAVESASAAVVDWDVPTPCADWRGVELAGHLLCMARYYHRLLDAALTSHPLSGLPTGQALASMNARDLASLPPSSGPQRIRDFVRIAAGYGDRLSRADREASIGDWSRIGPLTVAEHSLLAVGEWHIHAWDLARAAGGELQPSDPDVVLAGRRLLTVGVLDGDPWGAALRWAGRDADWTCPSE